MEKSEQHIGILTTGLTGMMNACTQVAHRLSNNGFKVTFFGGQKVCSKVDSRKFNTVLFPQIDSYLSRESFHNIGRASRFVSKVTGNINKIHDNLIDALELSNFLRDVHSSECDLLLVDMEMHEFIIPLLASEVRMVLISPWFCGTRTDGVPPLTSLSIPNSNSHNNFDQEWETYLSKRTSASLLSRYSTKRADTITRIAHRYQFDVATNSNSYSWPPPFTYTKLPIVSFTAAEMEFPFTPPGNFTYAGPMVLLTRHSDSSIQSRYSSDQGRLIYCVTSTVPGQTNPMIQVLCDAARKMSNDRFVITTGTQEQQVTFEVPDNVTLLDFAPQIEILRHADCCINHGGIHTIHECIMLNVPMVVYSGNRFDQNGCTARILYHELGVGGSNTDLTVDKVIEDVDAITAIDSVYRTNVEIMRERFAEYESNRVLEEFISNQINA